MQAAGITASAIMGFCKDVGAFAHSNGEVRESAKNITVALQGMVGTPVLEEFLQLLRPKQLEEYYTAFDSQLGVQNGVEIISAAVAPSPSSSSAGASVVNASSSSSTTNQQHHIPISARSKDTEKGACMFCDRPGLETEDALDLHYWQECPMLASCPSCTQVVEVGAMTEHQITECENKDDYIECETTGLAVPKTKFADWRMSEQCATPPAGSICCALCFYPVKQSDWKNHILHDCTANPRIGGGGGP